MITLEDIRERLRNEDETTLIDLLHITSEEIVRAFKGRTRSLASELSDYYNYEDTNENPEEENEEFADLEEFGDRTRGSALWEENEVPDEPEDY